MYLGSDFHRFWARCGTHVQHPDDAEYLHDSPFDNEVRPCPFDGPLERAKVVICLASPSYGAKHAPAALNQLVMSLRSGEEPLPEHFSAFYQPITRPIGIPLSVLREYVAVFNVCPYASELMYDHAMRLAAGLPSVWQAQKYLREVLILRAQTGKIYLILIRKLQLWGLTDRMKFIGNLRIVGGNARNGILPQDLGRDIAAWMLKKGVLSEPE